MDIIQWMARYQAYKRDALQVIQTRPYVNGKWVAAGRMHGKSYAVAYDYGIEHEQLAIAMIQRGIALDAAGPRPA